MNAQPGDVAAPLFSLLTRVGEVGEVAALPPALACIPDARLDVGLITWRPHASWVQEQTARLAVLQKRARRPWVQRVWPGDRRRKVVEDESDRQAATEEAPRLLRSFDRGLHRLLEQRP